MKKVLGLLMALVLMSCLTFAQNPHPARDTELGGYVSDIARELGADGYYDSLPVETQLKWIAGFEAILEEASYLPKVENHYDRRNGEFYERMAKAPAVVFNEAEKLEALLPKEPEKNAELKKAIVRLKEYVVKFKQE